MNEQVHKHIGDMFERNVIEPFVSQGIAGVVLAKTKGGTTRFCIDY